MIAQNWDPSVKAMMRFPEVLKKMSDDLQWTTSLEDAIVNQPQDVANAIQLLRPEAQRTGTLETTNEQKVTTESQEGSDDKKRARGRFLPARKCEADTEELPEERRRFAMLSIPRHAPDLILALRDTLADAEAAQSMPLFLAHSPVG